MHRQSKINTTHTTPADHALARILLLVPALLAAACGPSPLAPEDDVVGVYDLTAVDNNAETWTLSDPDDPILWEVYEASIDLHYDQSCVLRKILAETDRTDPTDWVQTLHEDWANCTYMVEGDDVYLTFIPAWADEAAGRISPFIFPDGGTLRARYSGDAQPRGDNVYVQRTLSFTEDGRHYRYETRENSGGSGGPSWW